MLQPIDNNAKIQANKAEIYARKARDFHIKNDYKNAVKFANLAISKAPKISDYYHSLGVIHQQHGDFRKAALNFKRAIKQNKSNPVYYYHLGIALKEMGDFEQSLETQKIALSLSTNKLLSLNEIGLLQLKLNDLPNAESSFLAAYQIDPQDITTCINLSHFYALNRDVRRSIEYAQKSILINPNRPEPYYNMGKALISANYHKEGIDCLRKSIQVSNSYSSYTQQSILMIMLYADCFTPSEIFAEHIRWAKNQVLPNIIQKRNFSNDKDKILNIGFISPDFKDHSISHFLIPLLEKINHRNFRICCYSLVRHPDSVTTEIQQLSHVWQDITEKNDEEVIHQIKQDEIDILIDLSGHSLGSRLEIFSQKPAPIQFSYLGYPFSTGLDSMDYRITDNLSDPEGSTEHLHTETLIRMDPSFLCYKPGKLIPISESLPVEKNGYITFGSLNNFSKLSKETIMIWAAILNSVNNARIVLKNNQPIPELLKDNIIGEFLKYNIDLSRITLYHPLEDKNEHITLYNEIDICLDPTPYNGTTTTFESLFMGVPVISMCGNMHHSRVGYSILQNLDLNELVAKSTIEYANIASNLSNDIPKLKHFRQSLRERLLTSQLTDSTNFTKKFEEILKNTWNHYCDSQISKS